MKVRKLLSRIPLILALAVAIVLVFSYLDLKRNIVAALSEKATRAFGQEVSIQDVSFDFPAIINRYDLSVKNPEGFPPGEEDPAVGVMPEVIGHPWKSLWRRSYRGALRGGLRQMSIELWTLITP